MTAKTGFILNYENKLYIDTTPSAETPTWSEVSGGIKNRSHAGNENIDQTPYYDGGGMASTQVLGGQLVISVTGDRKAGDTVQDYVLGLAFTFGEARKTKAKVEFADGRVLTGNCTIANINEAAGDANAKDEVSFEIHFNGAPAVTTGNASEQPAG